MAAPTLIASGLVGTKNQTAQSPTTSFASTGQSGDIIVVAAVNEAPWTTAVPTVADSGGSHTVLANPIGSGYTGLLTSTRTLTGAITSVTVTRNVNDAGKQVTAYYYIYRGASGVANAVATATTTTGASKTLTLTTGQANSAVVCIGGDWAAAATTPSLYDASITGTDDQTETSAAAYRFALGHYADAGVAGTKTVGVDGGTASSVWNIAYVEVVGPILTPVVTLRSGVASTTNNSAVASASFTPVQGELLVVFSMHSGSTAAPTFSASANGITFTTIKTALKNTSADIVAVGVANQLIGASPAAMTVSSTPSASTATGGIVFVYSVTNIIRTGADAIRQSAATANGAAAGTPAATFTGASLSGNPLLGCVGNSTSPATMTPPTGWTETATIGDLGYSTPTSGAETAFLTAGATASTYTWGGTSASAFGVVLVELDSTKYPARPIRMTPGVSVVQSTRW